MSLALRRIQAYLKLVAIIAVVAMVLIIVLMNQNNLADIWFFGLYRDVNVLWLILVTAVSSIGGWWIVRKVFRVLREMRELREERRRNQEREAQRRLAEELADREKRLDEKLRRSITEDA